MAPEAKMDGYSWQGISISNSLAKYFIVIVSNINGGKENEKSDCSNSPGGIDGRVTGPICMEDDLLARTSGTCNYRDMYNPGADGIGYLVS